MKELLECWKKAVVHLECGTQNTRLSSPESQHEAAQWLMKGEISIQDYADLLILPTSDKRTWGTALFVQHDGQYFLATARHVLQGDRDCTDERVLPLIFRVPSLDEYIRHEDMGHPEHWSPTEFLMNLTAETDDSLNDQCLDYPASLAPYTFSASSLNKTPQ